MCGDGRSLPCSWGHEHQTGDVQEVWVRLRLQGEGQGALFGADRGSGATAEKFFPYLLLISNCSFKSGKGKHWPASPAVWCLQISDRETCCNSVLTCRDTPFSSL